MAFLRSSVSQLLRFPHKVQPEHKNDTLKRQGSVKEGSGFRVLDPTAGLTAAAGMMSKLMGGVHGNTQNASDEGYETASISSSEPPPYDELDESETVAGSDSGESTLSASELYEASYRLRRAAEAASRGDVEFAQMEYRAALSGAYSAVRGKYTHLMMMECDTRC
jgi:hypothetical protein